MPQAHFTEPVVQPVPSLSDAPAQEQMRSRGPSIDDWTVVQKDESAKLKKVEEDPNSYFSDASEVQAPEACKVNGSEAKKLHVALAHYVKLLEYGCAFWIIVLAYWVCIYWDDLSKGGIASLSQNLNLNLDNVPIEIVASAESDFNQTPLKFAEPQNIEELSRNPNRTDSADQQPKLRWTTLYQCLSDVAKAKDDGHGMVNTTNTTVTSNSTTASSDLSGLISSQTPMQSNKLHVAYRGLQMDLIEIFSKLVRPLEIQSKTDSNVRTMRTAFEKIVTTKKNSEADSGLVEWADRSKSAIPLFKLRVLLKNLGTNLPKLFAPCLNMKASATSTEKRHVSPFSDFQALAWALESDVAYSTSQSQDDDSDSDKGTSTYRFVVHGQDLDTNSPNDSSESIVLEVAPSTFHVRVTSSATGFSVNFRRPDINGRRSNLPLTFVSTNNGDVIGEL